MISIEEEKKALGLYLHFPFCVRKCLYCDFLSAPADEDTKRLYARALVREIRAYGETAGNRTVSTVFLGGGTPSVMPADSLSAVMKAVHDTFHVEKDAEITIEVNPGTISESLLSFCFNYINRVSLGLQSVHEEELKALGRIHTYGQFLSGYEALREAGIKNINIDLMSGIPGQTVGGFTETLNAAADLSPEHISAYSLIVEKGTPFYEMKNAGKLDLPDEDAERGMYHLTKKLLALRGYRQYEISNYARPGFECRHNVRYWRRGDYLGFGIGAASFLDRTRWKNTSRLSYYLDHSASPRDITEDIEELSVKDEVEEFMFLGLRMNDGITAEAFKKAFSLDLLSVYGETLEKYEKEGLMEHSGGRYFLTSRGADISNTVLSGFLL